MALDSDIQYKIKFAVSSSSQKAKEKKKALELFTCSNFSLEYTKFWQKIYKIDMELQLFFPLPNFTFISKYKCALLRAKNTLMFKKHSSVEKSNHLFENS